MSAGFLELIQQDLNQVDAKVAKAFKIKSGHLSSYAHIETEPVQKLLHPALVLFSGRILNYSGQKLVYLASVVQFIFLAASIHFRIPDDNTRHRNDLPNGAQTPVLAGDYLYGKYFVGLCEGGILEFLSPLANIIAEMNHGALLRKKSSGTPVHDPELLMTIIKKETALLMEGAARFAGRVAGGSEDQIERLAGVGLSFGMAYGFLERNLDPALAEPYFQQALARLGELPAGKARDCMEEMIKKFRSGELPVPLKAIGGSRAFEADLGEGAVNISETEGKERYVHSVFSSIARKYDSLNTVLSFNQDKYWRRFTVEQTGLKPGGIVLDVCCGTGMITLELAKKVGPGGKVIGLDFCEDMLEIAKKNPAVSQHSRVIEFLQGNAMALPFPDNTFDCVTIGFGLRNVPDMKKAIREIIRVLKPEGRIVCLEFSKPTVPVFKQVYNFYFDKCVPFLGKLGVGTEGPYRYLHNSWKAFPHQAELKSVFLGLGLRDVSYYELTGGVVSVHVGVKPAEATVSSVAATKE